jgi:hypothetical protein
MRRSLLLALMLCLIPLARGQTGSLTGFCVQGGVSAAVQGLQSTNKLQGIIPSCTVTVYLTGTHTLATLYSDAVGDPLTNPFTAAALGTALPGQWLFFAENNVGYDIVLSGGILPNVYAAPVSITGQWIIGAGGGVGSIPPVDSVQFASNTIGGFGSDPSITINPTEHTLTVGTPGTGGQFGACGITSGLCVLQEVSPTTAGMYLMWPAYAPTGLNPCLVGNVTGTQNSLPLITGSWNNNCGSSYPPGFFDGTGNAVGPSDTTFTLGSSNENGYGPGYLYIDSEWIYYQSIVASTVTVAPGGRGWFGTTAASHSFGVGVYGATVALSNQGVLPYAPIIGPLSAGGEVMGINNAYPNSQGGQVSLEINQSSNGLWVDRQGGVHQLNPSAAQYFINGFQPRPGNEFAAPIWVGPNSVASIPDTSYVVSANIQNQLTAPVGIQGGLAGPVSTVQAPTVGAPSVFPVFNSGSTTWTYVCQGVDTDGNLIPGTSGNVVGAATLTSPQAMTGQCPFAAGADSMLVYRTAGGPNVGLVTTVTQQRAYWSDFGGPLNGASPSGTNGDIPRLCNNNQQFCILSGSSGTPPIACTGGQQGWEYHNVSATSSPFVLHCVNGSSWTTAY